MTDILDIHTHHQAPAPAAVISLSAVTLADQFTSPDDVTLMPGQAYSIGIHPWDTSAAPPDPKVIDMLNVLAKRPEVVAIGEAGTDTLKGGPMFRQLPIFKMHVDLSESLRKPLIIHDVKTHDVIIGLHRDLNPSMPWAIHGFRAKPSVAQMFLARGIYLSLPDRFNPLTAAEIPEHLLLAETDEAPLGIADVIREISEARGADMTDVIRKNSATFLNPK